MMNYEEIKERKALLDRMIRIYGFEHKAVIHFAKLVKNPVFKTGLLETIVKTHEKFPANNEEEF